jgi:hypothetical protein
MDDIESEILSDIECHCDIAAYHSVNDGFDIVPLVYNDDVDTTVITNILLIDNTVQEYQQFVDGCNITTFPIVYDYHSDRNELKELLRRKFNNIQRIAFVFHNADMTGKLFLNNECFFNEGDLTFSENVQYLVNIIRYFQVTHVDYLACNSLEYDSWKQYYDLLTSATNVVVGASNDATGNLKYGGDWIMESTNEDVKTIYFNDSINQYTKTLVVYSKYYTYLNNYTNYSTGDSTYTTFTGYDNRGTTVQLNTPFNYNDINYSTVYINLNGMISFTALAGGVNLKPYNYAGIFAFHVDTDTTDTSKYYVRYKEFTDTFEVIYNTIYFNSNTTVADSPVKVKVTLKLNNNPNKGDVIIDYGTIKNYAYGNTIIAFGFGTGNTSHLTTGNFANVNQFSPPSSRQQDITGSQSQFSGKQLRFIVRATTISALSVPAGKKYGDAPFQLTDPTSNSNAAFQYTSSNSSVATISGKTVTIVGAGTTTITVSQPATTIYTDDTATALLTVSKATTTISSLSVPTGKKYGDAPFQLTDPTSNSNAAFQYTSSNTSVATISGKTVTIVGAGTTIITATKPTNTNFTAGSTTATFAVIKAITNISGLSVPVGKKYGDAPFQLTDPSSNNTQVAFQYASSNTSVATISGKTVTIVGAGTTIITATQAANANFTAASTTATFSVSQATTTISTLSVPTGKKYGDAPFQLTDPSSNNTQVAFQYTSSNTSVATISGKTITIVGAGTTVITATQAANTNFTIGSTTASFSVGKATAIISPLYVPLDAVYGDTPFQLTDPYSNNTEVAFQYTSSNTSVATISGKIVTIVGAGDTVITLSQAENANFTAGSTTALFSISKATTIISPLLLPSGAVYGDAPFQLTDPSSNNTEVAFQYTSSNTSVATVSGKTVTIVAAGDIIITLSQAENANFTAGSIHASFNIRKSTTLISNFSIPSGVVYGDPPFVLTDPSSNNTEVEFQYASSNTSVATISGKTVTIVGAGDTIITVSQPENSNFTAGSISVSLGGKKRTTIISSLYVPTTKKYGDAPFQLTDPSSNNTEVAFQYTSSNTSVATISGKTVSIVGAGDTIITLSQAENANFTAGYTTTSFSISKATTMISPLLLPSGAVYGDASFVLIDPSSNNTEVAFQYTSSNTSVAIISGKIVTIVGAGDAVITATQQENANFTADSTTTSFHVSKATTSITNFSVPLDAVYGDASFVLIDPSSNNTEVVFQYTTSNTSVATISGKTVTIVGAGDTIITATQQENANFTGDSTTVSFHVSKATASMSNFSVPSGAVYGDTPFQLTNPSSNSNADFSYNSSNPEIATISGKTVTIVGAGDTIITATQAENANFTADSVTASFHVSKAITSISNFSVTSGAVYGDTPFQLTNPSSNSNADFSYNSSNPEIATISGKLITIVGAGSTVITATQKENANFTAGSTTAPFKISKATTTISNFSVPSDAVYGDPPFLLIDPSSNNTEVPFQYTSSNQAIATISGKTVTIVGAGETDIIVSQATNNNYTAYTVPVSFNVSKARPYLRNFDIPTTIIEHTIIQLVPPQSNNTNGVFTYTSSDLTVAIIINDNQLNIIGNGETYITATQSETTNYLQESITAQFDTSIIDFPQITDIQPNKITGTSEPNSNVVITSTTIYNETLTTQIQSNSQGIWYFNITTPAKNYSFAPVNANQFSSSLISNYSFRYPQKKYTLTTNTPVLIKPRQNGINELDQRSWRISPKLPPGLKFSGVTGIISGTPTALAPLTTYNVWSNSEIFLSYRRQLIIEILSIP